MNTAMVGSAVRWVATILGTILTSKGIVDADTWSSIVTNGATIAGSALTLGTLLWSLWQKNQAAKESK